MQSVNVHFPFSGRDDSRALQLAGVGKGGGFDFSYCIHGRGGVGVADKERMEHFTLSRKSFLHLL